MGRYARKCGGKPIPTQDGASESLTGPYGPIYDIFARAKNRPKPKLIESALDRLLSRLTNQAFSYLRLKDTNTIAFFQTESPKTPIFEHMYQFSSFETFVMLRAKDAEQINVTKNTYERRQTFFLSGSASVCHVFTHKNQVVA